jgi:hypothetical protein
MILILVGFLCVALIVFAALGGTYVYTKEYGPEEEIDFDPADLGEVKLKGTEARYVWFGHDDESRQLVVEDILILDKLRRDKKCTGAAGPSQECVDVSRNDNSIEIDLGKKQKYNTIAVVNTLTGDLSTAKGALMRVYDADRNLLVETKPTENAWEVYEYDFLVRKWRKATHYKYGYTDEPPE